MRKFYFFSLLSFFQLHVAAQQSNSINHLMQYCRVNFGFNGVVLIANENNIIYQQSFGNANLNDTGNMNPETKFRLGSISKQFTAFIALQLIKKGSLSFNNKLAKYIPAFNQPGKRDITILNLLTHTSGLADYTSLTNFNDQIFYNKDSVIKMIATLPLSFAPSADYSYCNSNFYLLALIIEKITQKDLATVLQEMIFKKAGMQNSGEEEGIIKNEAIPFVRKNDSMVTAPFIEMRNTKGAGGMYSTAKDLLKWSLYFQRMLLKDTILKNVLQPFTLSGGTKTLYSCGWCLMPDVIFHTGHINGFANLIAIDTIHHTTIILLTNDDYSQLYVTMQSLQNILRNNTKLNNWVANKPSNNLADYKGVYSIGDFKVNIKDTANYLEGNVAGEKQLLRWYANDEFFFTNMEGIVKFERNNEGAVIDLISFQNYSWVTLTKE